MLGVMLAYARIWIDLQNTIPEVSTLDSRMVLFSTKLNNTLLCMHPCVYS